MRSSMLTGAVLALGCLVWLPLAAMAQFGPYGSYSLYEGAGPYVASARSANVSRQLAAQRHATTFDRGQQQMANQQRDIRASLSRQGQSRTASMERHVGDYKDWWFTTQQRQFAQRQARQQSRPAAAMPRGTASFSPSTMQSTPPQESTGIIAWPPVLRNAQFAEQRARVEGPFQTGINPTIKQYKGMIDATEKMKQTLKNNAYQISAGEYMEVEKFLDTLAAECQERVDHWTAKESAVELDEKPAAPGDDDK